MTASRPVFQLPPPSRGYPTPPVSLTARLPTLPLAPPAGEACILTSSTVLFCFFFGGVVYSFFYRASTSFFIGAHSSCYPTSILFPRPFPVDPPKDIREEVVI